MIRRLRQYIHAVAYVLLICLSWSYGPIQQYVATDTSYSSLFSLGTPKNTNARHSNTRHLQKNVNQQSDAYRAYFSDSEPDSEDDTEALQRSTTTLLASHRFGQLSADLSAAHYSRKVANILAQSAYLPLPNNDLYLHYRVFRLWFKHIFLLITPSLCF